MYIDKLDNIVNKHNNTYHRTIKMKLVDVKSSTYIDPSKEINDEDPKFKISDIVRISKCKNIFAKSYVPNCSEEIFVKKVKNTVPRTYVISDLKNFEKQMKKSLGLKELWKEKVINYMLNEKAMIVLLTAELLRKT